VGVKTKDNHLACDAGFIKGFAEPLDEIDPASG
jgi:hypothetical protein